MTSAEATPLIKKKAREAQQLKEMDFGGITAVPGGIRNNLTWASRKLC